MTGARSEQIQNTFLALQKYHGDHVLAKGVSVEEISICFLLGNVQQAQFTAALATWLPRWWSNSAYIQDDFKATSRLTLNLGMRWDYQPQGTEKYDRLHNFNPSITDPKFGIPGAVELAPPMAGTPPQYVQDVLGRLVAGLGDELPVSAFAPALPTSSRPWRKP